MLTLENSKNLYRMRYHSHSNQNLRCCIRRIVTSQFMSLLPPIALSSAT